MIRCWSPTYISGIYTLELLWCMYKEHNIYKGTPPWTPPKKTHGQNILIMYFSTWELYLSPVGAVCRAALA